MKPEKVDPGKKCDSLGESKDSPSTLPELWDHQKKAIQIAKDLPEFALFFEQGCGKTPTTLELLRNKYQTECGFKATLIICPPIVIENWRREALKWTNIPPNRIIPLIGTGKERLRKLNSAVDTFHDQVFVITNYETLLMKEVFEAFMKWKPVCLVLDESQRVKDGKSKRSKALLKLAPQTKYRYILSGTPVLNSPLDLFSQFKILDGGKTLGDNFYIFRANYFDDKNARMPSLKYFPDWRIREGSEEKITKLISSKSMRVEKKDCLDLPPLVQKTVYCELSSEQAVHYKSMKDNYLTFIQNNPCTATIALTKTMKMQQIVSGFLIAGDTKETEKAFSFEDHPRKKALRDLLEDIVPYHKCLVWAVWRENYKVIREVCESLKVKYVEIHGDISAKEKQISVDRINQDPEMRVCIGHPGSGGVGVNLTAASTSIWYSRSWSLEFELQAEARNHRGGSEIHDKITRYDIVAQGTIDELILDALAAKNKVSEKLLTDLDWARKNL